MDDRTIEASLSIPNSQIEEKKLTDTTETSHLPVEEAIYKILVEYLDGHPYLGPNSLENSDVKKSTIHSILNAQGKHKLVPRTLCGLMRSLHKRKTLKEIASLYKGPLGNALKMLVEDYGKNSNFEYESNHIERLLEDINIYKIIIMASSKTGVSQKELLSEMGNQCKGTLDKLLKEKILIKKNNKIYTDTDHSTDKMIGISTTRKLAANLITSSFWPENFGVSQHGNAITVRIVEVNPEWYRPRALKAHKQHQATLDKIYNDPKAKGNVCQYHIDVYSDVINPRNNSNIEDEISKRPINDEELKQ